MSGRQTARRTCDPTVTQAIARLTRDACLVMDPDGVILVANDEAARLYRYRAEELAGMHVSRLCADGSCAGLDGWSSSARREGLLVTSTHVRRDGTPFPVEVGWRSGSTGCCELLVAHVRDISERVGLERELRLRSDVLDATLDAIIVHDLEGRPVFANRTAVARAGMTHEEFMRLDRWGWLAEEAREATAERLALLREEGEHVFESLDTASDGSVYPVEVHARVEQLDGEPLVVAVVRDITERAEAMEALRRMASSDPLTGLANRAHLMEALRQAIEDARRHGDVLGVLFLDLDDFKPINDRFGHAAGDRVLVDIADRMKAGVRATDTVARMGGDEFAVILPRLADPEALVKAARKVAACAATSTDPSEEYATVTASIGAALFDPASDDADTLLAKADTAMYEAKRAGVVWRVWGEEW